MSDTVTFSVSAVGPISWGVEADLTAGTIRVRQKRVWKAGTLTTEDIAAARALVAPFHRAGNVSVRTQFADGEEHWAITLAGHTVTLDYETEGGGSPKALWRWATGMLKRFS